MGAHRHGGRNGGRRVRPPARPRGLSLLFLGLAALPALAWAVAPTPFTFEFDARTVLQNLWMESIEANQERVACLGGYFEAGVFYITRAERVRFQNADSTHASHGPSIDQCGPPEWAGTAHTHIAPYRGYPYATFSMSDRAVMGLWRVRWKREGVFCVLYSETEAYCEYDTTLSGDVAYQHQRGNVIFP